MKNSTKKTPKEEAIALAQELESCAISYAEESSKMQSRIDEIKNRHHPILKALDERISNTKAELESLSLECGDEIFGDAKSLAIGSITFGLRKSRARLVAFLKGGWEETLVRLQKQKWGRAYIRTKEEVDKTKLKATCPAKDLKSVGCKITGSEDEFFLKNS